MNLNHKTQKNRLILYATGTPYSSALAEVKSVSVMVGRHVTVPSVLYETKEWLEMVQGYE